jgi:putative ABC transport system permease protein
MSAPVEVEPARWLTGLLRRLSSRAAANAAIGDLLDELADRADAGRAPSWPRLWINLQAAGVAMSFASTALPRLWRSIWQVLNDSVRSLRRSPGYSILVVVILAVGIAAGTITYSVVDAVVLRPLAIDEGDRLITFSTRDDQFKPRVSQEGFRRIQDQVAGLDSAAQISFETGAVVTVADKTDQINIVEASSDVFQVLRFAPAVGRLWTRADEISGETDVAVLGYRYWIDHFNGDVSVIGQSVVNERHTYRVIGVLGAPSDVPGLQYSTAALWVPMPPAIPFGALGRMKAGVAPGRIADEIQRVLGTADWRPTASRLLDSYTSRVSGWMLLVLGAAALIVLIACVNAANVMLTRAFKRSHELAIRTSLGASRRQIAASVMTEGLVLAMTASGCALVFAIWGVDWARTAVTSHLPGMFRASTIALNGRVLAAAVGAAVITGIGAALVPAWHSSRYSVQGVLKDAAPTITGGGRRWRSALLVGEVASVTVLLVMSWLFVASLIRAAGIDLGVERSHLLAVSPRFEYTGALDDVRRRLESVPGVTKVAVVAGTSLPLIGAAFGGASTIIKLQLPEAPGDAQSVKTLDYRVTANYFEVAGMRFLRGATWPAEAPADSPSVVLDERVTAQLFGSEDPLGRSVRRDQPAGIFRIVGIVPHVYTHGPEVADAPAAYFALRPNPARTFATFFARTAGPAEAFVATVTTALAPVAPHGKSAYVFPADEAVRKITATRRFNGGLMSVFGIIAMIIGAAGIYGVISAVVVQQTREIGVRVALGATPRRIQRSVLALAARHVLAGLAIGFPLAWWLSRGLTAYLFQVTPADPSVYIVVGLMVAGVAFAAAVIPARRAAHTDPMVTLRT